MRLWAARRLARRARPENMALNTEAEEPPAFASLTAYLLCIVAKKLDAQSLASFAAACSACRAVAHEPLHEALLQVLKRCLRGIRIPPWIPNRPRSTSAWEAETFEGCSKNLKLLLLGNLTGIASDRSVTPPQWLPMFLASAQPPSPPPRSPSPPPPSPPPPSPSPPPPSPSPPGSVEYVVTFPDRGPDYPKGTITLSQDGP